MSGCTSAALSPVEGCCGNGGVRGVRGRCWGRNNRLEKQILNKKLLILQKTVFSPVLNEKVFQYRVGSGVGQITR